MVASKICSICYFHVYAREDDMRNVIKGFFIVLAILFVLGLPLSILGYIFGQERITCVEYSELKELKPCD